MDKIIVVIGHDIEVKEVPRIDDLKTMQGIVGGYVETVPLGNNIIAIVNEEGALMNLPFSYVGTRTFFGPVIIARSSAPDIIGLTGNDIEAITNLITPPVAGDEIN